VSIISATPNSGAVEVLAGDFLVSDFADLLADLDDFAGGLPDLDLVLATGLPAGFEFAAITPGELLSKNRPHATAVAHC
jgi:hypothetical protein